MAEEKEPRPLFKFDGTVNWPLLITVALIVLGAIGFGNKLVGQVDTLTTLVGGQAEEFKKMREDVNGIRLDMAKADNVRNMVVDHEARIRALEAK